jgi:hypothetical protein
MMVLCNSGRITGYSEVSTATHPTLENAVSPAPLPDGRAIYHGSARLLC